MLVKCPHETVYRYTGSDAASCWFECQACKTKFVHHGDEELKRERTYQLLQAAAIIRSSNDGMIQGWGRENSVTEAVELLALIEKQQEGE